MRVAKVAVLGAQATGRRWEPKRERIVFLQLPAVDPPQAPRYKPTETPLNTLHLTMQAPLVLSNSQLP